MKSEIIKRKNTAWVSFTKVFHLLHLQRKFTLHIVNLYQKERVSAGRPRSMPYQQKILEHFRAALPETTDLTEGQVGILFCVLVGCCWWQGRSRHWTRVGRWESCLTTWALSWVKSQELSSVNVISCSRSVPSRHSAETSGLAHDWVKSLVSRRLRKLMAAASDESGKVVNRRVGASIAMELCGCAQ